MATEFPIEMRTCGNCGNTDVRAANSCVEIPIPSFQHYYMEPSNMGYITIICDRCGRSVTTQYCSGGVVGRIRGIYPKYETALKRCCNLFTGKATRYQCMVSFDSGNTAGWINQGRCKNTKWRLLRASQ